MEVKCDDCNNKFFDNEFDYNENDDPICPKCGSDLWSYDEKYYEEK